MSLHQQAEAGVLTAPYLPALQQRGGEKLLKGLGYFKLTFSLGKGQPGLSKHTLHPLLPSSVLPTFSPCGDAMNQAQMLGNSQKSENKKAVVKSVPVWIAKKSKKLGFVINDGSK